MLWSLQLRRARRRAASRPAGARAVGSPLTICARTARPPSPRAAFVFPGGKICARAWPEPGGRGSGGGAVARANPRCVHTAPLRDLCPPLLSPTGVYTGLLDLLKRPLPAFSHSNCLLVAMLPPPPLQACTPAFLTCSSATKTCWPWSWGACFAQILWRGGTSRLAHAPSTLCRRSHHCCARADSANPAQLPATRLRTRWHWRPAPRPPTHTPSTALPRPPQPRGRARVGAPLL